MSEFTAFEDVADILNRVLASSTADETEVVWLQRRYGNVCNLKRPGPRPINFLEKPRLTVLVRVVEAGRQGWYRTETPDFHLLEDGVRQAMALAKVQEKANNQTVLPKPTPLDVPKDLFDAAISELRIESARSLLEDWCVDGLEGRLSWAETRLAIFNSHGLQRKARATEATLFSLAGHDAGAGRACGSARSLDGLASEHVGQRALDTRCTEPVAQLGSDRGPLLLAPEATIELLNLLNTYALSGRSYLEGTSFLSRHRNVQVFSRDFHLVDDGMRRPGLPFPFDFEGSPKAPLDLIIEGKPTTPALTKYQGAQAGLEPTAQAVGGQDALFGNLFLESGNADVPQLLQAAEGGLFIGWLDPPECYDPSHLHFRTVARSVRRIRDGRLAEPVEDLLWEESLLSAFARLRAIGQDALMRTTPTTLLGAISAPALVVDGTEGLRPLG